jgi:hypothetical protein
MAIFSTSGSKIFIGQFTASKLVDWIASDFNTFSWTEIGWCEAIGELGDESSEITFDAIGQGRTQKLKGIRNAGTMACRFGIDSADLGQIALRQAEQTQLDFAFRLDFDDQVSISSLPSSRYFIAKVMSAREVLDTANNVARLNASLGVNSNVVQTAPSTF